MYHAKPKSECMYLVYVMMRRYNGICVTVTCLCGCMELVMSLQLLLVCLDNPLVSHNCSNMSLSDLLLACMDCQFSHLFVYVCMCMYECVCMHAQVCMHM